MDELMMENLDNSSCGEEVLEEDILRRKMERRAFWKTIIMLPVLQKVFAAIVIAAGIYIGSLKLTGLVDIGFSREKTSSKGDIVKAELLELGELATLQYNYTLVGDLVYTEKMLWIPMEDRLIYSIDGTIKLGIDCRKLIIQVDEWSDTIVITLPPVEILVHELDETSYQEYYAKGDFSSEEWNEQRISDKRDQEVRMKDEGIMRQALDSAKVTLAAIVKAASRDAEHPKGYEIKFIETFEEEYYWRYRVWNLVIAGSVQRSRVWKDRSEIS